MIIKMEESAQIQSEDFGNEKPYNFSVVPKKIDQHLEFIDISEDGYLLLGSSNMILSYWNGTFWYFKDADLAPDKEHCLTGHGCDYSLACGKFLGSRDKIIVGDDSGAITVYYISTYPDDSTHVIPEMTSVHHDSSVTSLSISSCKTHTISTGCDLAINVWDNESLVSEHKYIPAHSRTITSIMASKEENSLTFASTSLDGLTLLWDPRLSKPASCIKQSHNNGMTALSWKNSNEVAIGYQSGEISITDIRTKKDVCVENVMDCSIHQLVFNKKSLLAICGDSTEVKVWDSEANKVIYTDKRHTRLVRDLVWHPISKKLYSCGFDKKVYSHQVEISES